MGLAASQARLLTITSRKSSAQFESMRLSHQKLALSRSLTDVSNEYQEALNKTRLYYDFYGNGSTDNLVSYGLFMTPSFINDYTPVLITNKQNRIVLSSDFAYAARLAGIPQEGLNGYVDQETRNRFIQGLTYLGIIDPVTSQVVQGTTYNPNVGLGLNLGLYTNVETESYSNFMTRLGNITLSEYNSNLSAAALENCLVIGEKSQITAYTVDNSVVPMSTAGANNHVMDSNIHRLTDTHAQNFRSDGTASFGTGGRWDNLTLYDILYGSQDIILTQNVQVGRNYTDPLNPYQYDDMLNIIKNVINLLAGQLASNYGVDEDVMLAIASANANMDASCWNSNESERLAYYTETTSGDYDDNTYHIHGNTVQPNSFSTNTDNLALWDHPRFSYVTNHDMYFTTAEDYYDENGNDYYTSLGFEPVSYWVSVPSTVDTNNTWNTYHLQPAYDTGSYSDNNINTARRNAVAYALTCANSNLALINMYDNSDQSGSDAQSGNYGAINLSKFVQAWFTYFMQSLASNKLDTATGDEYTALNNLLHGNNALDVNFRQQNRNSNLINTSYDLSAINFNSGEVLVDDGISDIASFYDTILNQICEYGWCENDMVKQDAGYLQEMLQSGKMFLFKLANDNYYYQKNYSTDTFIKEIEDESAIAAAEAKYKTEKAKINAKEEEIDIKMKNLDTEISALESEYDAVKKMINNNAQKAFQRYQS